MEKNKLLQVNLLYENYLYYWQLRIRSTYSFPHMLEVLCQAGYVVRCGPSPNQLEISKGLGGATY